MLAPDDRALLLEQLAPPTGYQLDAAVATTFTLDLTATLLPALAFTGFHLAGGLGDPIATLEALRSTAGKIDVFCQAGTIHVPDKSPDLLAFLEPMIHGVKAPSGGLFHPKIWFVKYADENGTPAYRLLVLTRNLTLDSSWDLALRLDSEELSRRNRAESAALGDLIESLPARTLREIPRARSARVASLATEARRIVWEQPERVDEVVLHLLDRGRKPSYSFRGSRHLIVSPFIDRAGIETVRPDGVVDVLSRTEELDKLDIGVREHLAARVLDDLAVVEQVQESRLGGQLHAKMYIVEQITQWSKSHVFIGSANATWAGFNANTEFLVELRGHRNYFGVDAFLGDNGAFLSVTQPYAPSGDVDEEPDDEAQRELDNAIRRVASIPHTIEIANAGSDASAGYSAQLSAAQPYEVAHNCRVTVELLTRPDIQTAVSPSSRLSATLKDLKSVEITPFLAIRIETPDGLRASSVVVAELRNDPPDRLDAILAAQVDTPEKFLKFLALLLSLGNPTALATLAKADAASQGDGGAFGPGGSGVLEMVLRALATKPAAIADLDSLVARMEGTPEGQASLPAGFAEFWSVVRGAIGNERGSR